MNLEPCNTNESEVLIDIDSFIQSVCKYDVFNPNDFRSKLKALIPDFKLIYRPNLKYSHSVLLFQKMVSDLDYITDINDIDQLSNAQILTLSDKAQYHGFDVEYELRSLQVQEHRNKSSLKEYLKDLIGHYSKLLFVRVDLSIHKDFQHEVNIETFNQYLKTFINRIQNKDTCFKDLQGYAWAVEQGERKGYHCHVLLIYDGHKHQSDYGLGMQVGECWEKITDQKGYFFLSNTSEYKKKFERKGMLGIGMIHRKDPLQVDNAINAAMYLVNPEKENQYLRVKVKGMRTFGKGVFEVDWRRPRKQVTSLEG